MGYLNSGYEEKENAGVENLDLGRLWLGAQARSLESGFQRGGNFLYKFPL